MIIKKKKLNKTLGNVPEQPQYDENSAEISDDIFSSVEQEILPQEEQEADFPDIIQAERVTENNIPQQIKPEPQKEITEEDLFSLDNIDFKQRLERRKEEGVRFTHNLRGYIRPQRVALCRRTCHKDTCCD